MRVTYTAQEMYEHIRSYDIIEFWGSRNEENVCMIKAKSSCVALRKGKRYSYISIECQLDPGSDILCCCCNITGNAFSCEVERGKKSERLIITSDCAEEPITLFLKNL